MKLESGVGSYWYGFNGQEKSDEIGNGHYTAEYWEYDSRIGRRWNVDPVVKPHESPYAVFANNPIWFTDPTGSDTLLFAKNFKRVPNPSEGDWQWKPEPSEVRKGGTDSYFWEHAQGNITIGGKSYIELWSQWSLRGHDYSIDGTDGLLINNFAESYLKYLAKEGVRYYSGDQLEDATTGGSGGDKSGKLDIAYTGFLTELTLNNGGKKNQTGLSNSLFLIEGKYGNANEAGNYGIGFAFADYRPLISLPTKGHIYSLVKNYQLDDPHEQAILKRGLNAGRANYNSYFDKKYGTNSQPFQLKKLHFPSKSK